jgi:hypothetical protein
VRGPQPQLVTDVECAWLVTDAEGVGGEGVADVTASAATAAAITKSHTCHVQTTSMEMR